MMTFCISASIQCVHIRHAIKCEYEIYDVCWLAHTQCRNSPRLLLLYQVLSVFSFVRDGCNCMPTLSHTQPHGMRMYEQIEARLAHTKPQPENAVNCEFETLRDT